jgi:hypothetical protein
MPECRTIRHLVGPVPGMKKLTMPEQVRYWTKPMQSGIFLVLYRYKIMDAGMPMPALVSSMPMPSYANREDILYVLQSSNSTRRQCELYRRNKIFR